MWLSDADALLTVPNVRKVTEYDETGEGITYLAVPVEAIEKAPTIESEPVRHGKWIRDDLGRTRCSVCEKPIPCIEEYDTDEDCGGTYEVDIDETPYCPICGAKMDLEG